MVNKNIVTMQDKGKYYGNINTELYKVNVLAVCIFFILSAVLFGFVNSTSK